jgi:tetratricopeptide (TPR) repeat protein
VIIRGYPWFKIKQGLSELVLRQPLFFDSFAFIDCQHVNITQHFYDNKTMKRYRLPWPALGFLIVFSILLPAQEQNPSITTSLPDDLGEISRESPAWLLRNWGRQARLDRNLSDAFLLLTRALEKDPNNPETLTELALSYSASNDFHQALEHLNKALENRARLSSPDLEYTILYQLADIYLQNRSSQTYIIDYERILLEITGA